MLNKLRMLTPGPTPLPDRVRFAMARDMIHHREPSFVALFSQVQQRLGQLFGTAQPVIPLTASGSGAMSAAVANLFREGEAVIVVVGGQFGERWMEICKAQGVKTYPISVEWGESVTVEAVAQALDAHPDARGILVQVSETSTGVMHPVKELAALTAKRDVLLVADGVSSISLSPCPMDEWGLDVLLTGSQKGLLLPPGLSFIALSAKAWKKAESFPCRDYYFNLVSERDNNEKSQTHFTPAISLLYGLHESLEMLFEDGLEAVYKKQWALANMARAGATAIGLEPFAKTSFAWGLTSVALPAGINSGPLLAHMAERHGVVMASGMGKIKERYIRIGHMGWVDWADLAAGLYALSSSFIALGGHSGSRNYLETALAAYESALTDPLPM